MEVPKSRWFGVADAGSAGLTSLSASPTSCVFLHSTGPWDYLVSRYKLVVFDFDGTLADSAPWFMRTLNDVADRHGFRKVTDAEIEMLRGRPNREIIRYLGVRFWQLPGIARDMRARSAEAADRIPLFEGIGDVLRTLRRTGTMIAVVSSNREDTVRRVLGGLADLVDHYECGVSLFGKRARFKRLTRRLGLASGQVLAVGDEGRDVEAAAAAGFASAAVTWGYATESALRDCGPTFVIHSPAEIASLVNG